MFLKIPQSSQENTCARVSLLINLQAWGYLKKTSIGCFYSSSVLDALKTLQMHQNWNLFTHNSEKNYSNIFFNFFSIKLEKPCYVCFFTLFPFSLKFLHTSLITKELIKHKTNSTEKSFTIEKIMKSIFRIFVFHEMLQKVNHEHFSLIYAMDLPEIPISWNALKEIFYSVFSPLQK